MAPLKQRRSRTMGLSNMGIIPYFALSSLIHSRRRTTRPTHEYRHVGAALGFLNKRTRRLRGLPVAEWRGEEIHRERRHRADANHQRVLVDEELGVVVRRGLGRVLIFRRDAEEHVKSRHGLGVKREVFRRAGERTLGHVSIGRALQCGRHLRGQGRVVDESSRTSA